MPEWTTWLDGCEGNALSWAQALHANGTLEMLTAEEFLWRVRQVFRPAALRQQRHR